MGQPANNVLYWEIDEDEYTLLSASSFTDLANDFSYTLTVNGKTYYYALQYTIDMGEIFNLQQLGITIEEKSFRQSNQPGIIVPPVPSSEPETP